jgi:CubicO group peptidase (beta-lactamase class C family)
MKFTKIIAVASLIIFESNAANLAIDTIVTEAVNKGEFNGSVLVAKDNSVIYRKAYGYANGSKTEKLTLQHRFNIGSISKEFPAIALDILLKEHGLSLEQPISDFINNLPVWSNSIQLKHLVNYSSGLPDFPWSVGLANEDALKSLQKLANLQHPPGEGYNYSYYNNFLLALIIEKISEKVFEQYLYETIFSPLKMIHTENNLNIPQSSLPTAKAFDSGGKEDDYRVAITGPSIYTTVDDLFKWVLSIENNQLIDIKSLGLMARPLSLETKSQGFTLQQSAFGSLKYKGGELAVLFHDGSHFNFHSVLYFDKANKQVVLILSNNKSDSKIFSIANKIISLLHSEVDDKS